MAALATRAPRYVRVASRLIGSIRDGRYPVGALLPTEAALCAKFGVSRITVRGAMRELESRGLVARRRGIGTRVTALAPTERLERSIYATENLQDLSLITADLQFKLLDARTERVGRRLAAQCELPPGERFQCVRGLRIDRRGRTHCHTTMYIAERVALAPAALDGRSGSIGQWIAECAGDPIAEARQIIEAKNLSAAQARLLGATAGAAALVTRRWYIGSSGRLVLVATSVFPRGRFAARIRQDQPQPSQPRSS